jgi:transposase
MAIPAQPLLIGVDVSKATLAICLGPDQPVQSLDNDRKSIARWLATLPAGPVCIAAEATNTFHLDLVDLAHRAGHTVYLVDGYRLSRYRDSIGTRAKTDASDAQLLQRYLAHERDSLRPWSPPPKGYRTLQQLLNRRATLVRARVALQQSLADLPGLKQAAATLFRQLKRIDQKIQQGLVDALSELDWDADSKRCQGIEGVGPLTAAALTMSFHRGAFRSSDAFVAFLGLDVRVRDSGQLRGRRRLTKKGSPELRRLLFLAAMQAARSRSWKDFYQRHLDRGFSRVQALVILARKLARVAFALLKNQTDYRPKYLKEACMET